MTGFVWPALLVLVPLIGWKVVPFAYRLAGRPLEKEYLDDGYFRRGNRYLIGVMPSFVLFLIWLVALMGTVDLLK